MKWNNTRTSQLLQHKKSILLWLILLTCACAKAQYTDSTAHYAGFSSTGSYNKTGTGTSYLLNNALRFGIRKKELALNSTNKFLYGRLNKALTNNDVSSVWDVNLYKTFPHFYYWGLFNYNSTFSLKINNQLQAGVGAAYKVVDKKYLVINLSDGIIYDYSDLQLSDSVRDIYATPRNSFRLQFKWTYKNILSFNGNGFLQNSLQNAQDYIIKSDVSLSVKLKKWLSFSSVFSYNKMARTKSENLLLTFGFSIENYF